MAKEIESYSVYDSDGNLIGTYTAEDANNYINPAEVQTAVTNIKTTVNGQLNGIAGKLSGVDVSRTVLVQGTTIDGQVNEVIKGIVGSTTDTGEGSATSSLDSLVTAAEAAHDNIQSQLNEQAYNAAQTAAVAASGSVR